MNKKIFFLLLVSLILTGCQIKKSPVDNSVACTLEAKICPDGSAVGRIGPNCEFAACPDNNENKNNIYKTITSQSINQASSKFSFQSQIPNNWQAEAITSINAINIFDPTISGENNLEKSQIFIRFFEANSFLTLNTVTIYAKENTIINARPAVVYDIEKKSNVANFVSQPLWRSQRHIVTDIRTSDSNPTIFYVIAKSPNLDQEIYDNFLNNLNLTNNTTKLTEPVTGFKSRITKKPFGTYITPKNSPVQPEQFTGYHTGVDIEYEDINEDVPIYAITNGTVVSSGFVNGYGGVISIKHQINGQTYIAVYGHLDPESLISNNSPVTAGQKIGILGDGYTSETDGERKHLHFSLRLGNNINLAGYVKSSSELNNWIDPQNIIK